MSAVIMITTIAMVGINSLTLMAVGVEATQDNTAEVSKIDDEPLRQIDKIVDIYNKETDNNINIERYISSLDSTTKDNTRKKILEYIEYLETSKVKHNFDIKGLKNYIVTKKDEQKEAERKAKQKEAEEKAKQKAQKEAEQAKAEEEAKRKAEEEELARLQELKDDSYYWDGDQNGYVDSNKKLDLIKAAGISSSDYEYVDYIISNESGWNYLIGNSYVYGLPQASSEHNLPDDFYSNPASQMEWSNDYALSKYGSWSQAYSHWLDFGSW